MPTFVGDPPTITAPDPPDEPDDPEGEELPTATHTYEGDGAGLQAYLDGVPDGAVVALDTETTYTIGGASAQLHLANRSLTVLGNGSTIKRSAAGTTAIVLIDQGGGPYAFYDLLVEGSKSSSTGKWDVTYEHEHGFLVGGAQDVEFVRCEVHDVGGDGLNLQGGADQWASNVRYHHGVFDNVGRMGVAITDGAEDVLISYNSFSNIGYYTWDIEPNGATVDGRDAGGLRVTFSNNTIGTKPYGDYPTDGTQALGYLLAITGASGGGPAMQITVQDNTMSAGEIRIGVFDNGVDCHDISVIGNTGSSTFTGSDPSHCITFNGVTGGAIQDNDQPCSDPSDLYSIAGSTGITVSGNTT